jgi:hypothetical protein
MSNQRAGKMHPAAMRDNGQVNEMTLVTFFKSAKEVLEREGHEDVAFYFEQCEDWLRSGKKITSDAGRILGL